MNKSNHKNFSFITIFLLLSAFLPVTIMSGQKLPSPIFYTLILIALVVIGKFKNPSVSKVINNNKLVLFSMACPLFVVLFSGAINGKIPGLDLETAIRFFLGLLILLLAYSQIEQTKLQTVMWGFIATCIVASAFIIYLVLTAGGRPLTTAVSNAVSYGSLTELFTVIVLFSTRIHLTRFFKTELLFKIAVVVVGFIAVVLTQTRTAWVAMPIFIIIAAILFSDISISNKNKKTNSSNVKNHKKIIFFVITSTIALSAFMVNNDTMRNRVNLAYQEAVNCVGDQSRTDNSICIRFQLWRASFDMMQQRPLAGNGSKRYFNNYMQNESFEKGIVSEYVAKNWGEPHNDMFLQLASFGIPGGIALLFVYLGPSYIFIRRLSYKNPKIIRTAAAMGLCVCLGFMIFGLTETMFRHMRTVSFYAMAIAFFMALSYDRGNIKND